MRIAHRDIKGGNVLVDVTGKCKIADFGTSSHIAELATTDKIITGTPYWMAPEVIKQEGHGRQVDVWSVGCTVIEMCTGMPPWSHLRTPAAALYHIGNTEVPPPLPDDVSDECKDFILHCLIRDPKKRPKAKVLLKHPWLDDGTDDSPATANNSNNVVTSSPAVQPARVGDHVSHRHLPELSDGDDTPGTDGFVAADGSDSGAGTSGGGGAAAAAAVAVAKTESYSLRVD